MSHGACAGNSGSSPAASVAGLNGMPLTVSAFIPASQAICPAKQSSASVPQ